MKVFKLAIYALIAVIVVCLVVLIIQPEKSLVLRPDAEIESDINLKQTQVIEEPVEQVEAAIPERIDLSPAELANMPAFIQHLPEKAAEVDSNGNMIRDDIELYVSYLYPYKPKIRAVYFQLAMAIDAVAKERGKGRLSKQFMLYQAEHDAETCWKKNGFSEDELNAFKAMLLNNSYRLESYQATLEMRETLDKDILESLVTNEQPCDVLITENQVALQHWEPKH